MYNSEELALSSSEVVVASRVSCGPEDASVSDPYARSLENTLQSQNFELERLRKACANGNALRVTAERANEATKTELINAKLLFSVELADQRCEQAEIIDRKVTERSSGLIVDLRRSLVAAEEAHSAATKALSATRLRLDGETDEAKAARASAQSRGWLLVVLFCCLAAALLTSARASHSHRHRVQTLRAKHQRCAVEVGGQREVLERHRESSRAYRSREVCEASVDVVREAASAVIDASLFFVSIPNVAHVLDLASEAAATCRSTDSSLSTTSDTL